MLCMASIDTAYWALGQLVLVSGAGGTRDEPRLTDR